MDDEELRDCAKARIHEWGAEGEIEVDDNARIVRLDEEDRGAWVAAWIYVPLEDE